MLLISDSFLQIESSINETSVLESDMSKIYGRSILQSHENIVSALYFNTLNCEEVSYLLDDVNNGENKINLLAQ